MTIPDHDPAAFRVECPGGRSPFLITCDHASRRLPYRLGTLGLGAADLSRHIAWDLGAGALAEKLARGLDACAILHGYSRLAIDPNRPPGAPDSIVRTSDDSVIPGNQGLCADEADRRARELFHPYHDRIAAELDQRAQANRPTVLVALHSFTPSLGGRARPWHIGVLYLRDDRFARQLLALLRAEADLVVGDNEPYAASVATDYTIVVHGERRGLPYVEIEIRQDLINDEPSQQAWATRLGALLVRAHELLFPR